MLQLNQINCESSDSESETENTISINMIAVENDYEPIIYEQPFSSHIYENQSELLHNYYIEPIHSTPTTQKTNEINTTNQPNENDKTKCLNTNHIYQNIQKEQPKEKIWTIPFLLESPRSKEFQPPDLEIDFLIDSGAESNIINIPTWNEIKTLHPKLTPLETSSKLATAQGSNFSQMPNAAESLQMTMNPYLMGGSSITSNKPLMVFTGTDPEYSVEDYLNAVTANLILNIGPEPINTPLHQNWIHRRTALIQTTLDGAAQKWFSVLPIEIKSNWKRFTQEFSKMFDSERNKQQQRVLCNEIRRLPNETIKQLAVRIETLVRKAYSLNTHDYKNTKMTEILMMTLTPQLRKIAIKKRASHPSSIREPDLDFRKLVDKLEQAEITMKLEETENLKLQYVNRIETNTTSINNIQESDTDLVEKITEILNIYEKHPNFKGKPSFKKWCNYCRRYGHSISECRQKQQDNQNKPQKYKEPNKSFYQYMKKDQNLPNKTWTATTVQENHSRLIQIIQEINHHITQVIEEDHQNEEIREIHHKITTIDQIVEITTPGQIQIQHDLFLDLIPNQEIITIQTINHEIHHTIGIETTPIIGIEVIQTTETRITRTIDQGIIHIIDRTITEQTIITKTDHEIIHKIDIQVIIIVIEIIPNHHTGIITIIIILIIAIEVVHLNIKGI